MMTDAEIIDYFDTHWNCTLAELSAMSGRSVASLKSLLMGTPHEILMETNK